MAGKPLVLVNGISMQSQLTGVGYYTLELFSELAKMRLGTEKNKYSSAELPRKSAESSIFLFDGKANITQWSGSQFEQIDNNFWKISDTAIGKVDDLKFLVRGWLKKNFGSSIWLRKYVRDYHSCQFRLAVRSLGQAFVYHEPNFIAFPYDGPSVVTVHDLSFLRRPQTHPSDRVRFMNENIEGSLIQASRVVVVSEFVRREVESLFGSEIAEKTVVIRNGVSARFRPTVCVDSVSKTLKKFGLKHRGYLLSVGALEPRKNLLSLVEAYVQLPMNLKLRYPLILVGPKGWHLQALERRLHALRHEPIQWLGYLSSEALRSVYASARAFAYLSTYEGFGLPVLESMACGTPVLVSQAGALKELVGKSGMTVHAYDIKSITEKLEARLSDDTLWNLHRTKGLKISEALSWTRAAHKMEEIYAELI